MTQSTIKALKEMPGPWKASDTGPRVYQDAVCCWFEKNRETIKASLTAQIQEGSEAQNYARKYKERYGISVWNQGQLLSDLLLILEGEYTDEQLMKDWK